MTDQALKQGKILLVDDDEAVLTVTCRLLEISGYNVVAAKGGREGVEIFRQSADDFRLAVVDLTMPELDGIAVTEELLKIRPDFRVVLSSGHDQAVAEARYRKHGFVGFLQKPYNSRRLIQMMEDALVP